MYKSLKKGTNIKKEGILNMDVYHYILHSKLISAPRLN